MEFTEFRKQLNAGGPKPAYLLDRFSSAEAAKALQLLERTPREPAREVLRETFVAPEQVSAALVSARSHPMWGEHKLIVLAEMESLAAKAQQKVRDALVAYLGDPSPWVTLVMVSGKEAAPAGGLSALARRATVVSAPKLAGAGLAAWVRRILTEARLEIEPEALETLLQVCKGDWAAIENELEKIIAAFPPGSVVGAETLQFLVEPRLEESIFSLLRLLAEGQTGAVLEKMELLLRGQKQERLLYLWYWLYQQTRDLLGMKEVTARGLGPDILESIGLNPRAQAALRWQLRNFPKSTLREMLQTLEQVDRQLKSSYTAHPRILLERYLIRLGQSRTRRYSKGPEAPAMR